jgi:hypothetical protein
MTPSVALVFAALAIATHPYLAAAGSEWWTNIQSAAPQSANAVGGWGFDTVGDELHDDTGHGNDLENVGNTTIVTENRTDLYNDSYIVLRKTNPNILRTPAGLGASATGTTISAWFSVDSADYDDYVQAIHQIVTGPFLIHVTPVTITNAYAEYGYRMKSVLRWGGAMYNSFDDSEYADTPLRWGRVFHHVCMGWNNASGSISHLVVIDSVVIKNYAAAQADPHPADATPVTSGTHIYFGTSNGSHAIPLRMNHVVVWNVPLTATECQVMFNLTRPPEGHDDTSVVGNATTPIAKFKFVGGSLANSVSGSHMGLLKFSSETGDVGVWPNNGPSNFSQFISTASNPMGVGWDAYVGQDLALYITTGGVRAWQYSFCYPFKVIGDGVWGTVAIDSTYNRMSWRNPSDQSGSIVGGSIMCADFGDTTDSGSITYWQDCCSLADPLAAYDIGAWNHACVVVPFNSFLAPSFSVYVNGVFQYTKDYDLSVCSYQWCSAIYAYDANFVLPTSPNVEIGELDVYNVALSEDDIMTLYNAYTTAAPTGTPTDAPTYVPTATPSAKPTAKPSAKPSASPSVAPSIGPSAAPTTATPVSEPTASPSAEPTEEPTAAPVTSTSAPSSSPVAEPTSRPSRAPSAAPTAPATDRPTQYGRRRRPS